MVSNWLRSLQRGRHLLVGVGERVGELREIVVECDELLIALVQRVDEQRQALDHCEEVAAALVERGQRLRQRVQRLVELLALAGEARRRRLDDVAERPLGLFGRRPEVGRGSG